ncbi:MAG: aspartate aminotransferase family protein [Chloroflexi bacterium]|nr:aspartate aminotransferase family protein [Chloroflexota bacterium]MDA1241243.1 aspartate aminotransferase family protein [Chloroflexota bacterium]MQC25384.1 aspartate aminotransferase family protein [Chloroflexota bacterium]
MTLDLDTYEALAREDQTHLLHPQYYAPDHERPVVFDHGQGVWLVDVQGKRYIDALASLWNVAVGHGRGELADAAAEQMRKVAFTNNYVGFSNVPAIRLASKVIDLAYDNMQGVFFTNSGSESNEGALKAARFYWNLQGRPGKVKLISRERSYHGGTLAASAMTGLPAFWKYFGPLAPEISHTKKPDNLECDCTPNSDGECACWMEQAILREDPDTVAAIIVEPVKGAGGVWTPSDDYFPRLREICDRYEVLMIADEVITGFGRTGRWFALEHWGVQPDILSIAKAITSGYVPMGAFIVSAEIFEALKQAPTDARFMHAYTNSGHPTAAAVGLRNLQIMEDERLVENAAVMGEVLADGLRGALEGHPNVAKLRHLGLMAGFSLVKDATTGETFEPSAQTAIRVQRHMREEGGVITRIVADHVVFAPPLVVNASEIGQIVDATRAAVRAVTGT